MTDEPKVPSPGNTFYDSAGEDFEISEVTQEFEDNTFEVADEEGDLANIKWSEANDRWEVDE